MWKDLDICPVCEKGQLHLTKEPEIMTGEFGKLIEGKISVPYSFESRWLVCNLCDERLLTTEDDIRWNKMSEELKIEFDRINNVQPLEETVVKFNGGVQCDMEDGPCSCGAWHHSIKK